MRWLMILVLAAAGCGTDDPSVTAAQRGKPVVITALHPLADAIRRVGGDAVVVVDLVPVGDSPHELELTPRQREEILEADVAVVLGKGFQPGVEAAAARRDGATLSVLESLDLPDRPDGVDGPIDPHVWLDPTIMGSIVTALADAVATVVPDERDGILDRAANIVEENVRLDAQLRIGLADCTRDAIVSHHESFGWFAKRYGLTNVGFDAPIPDDDPAPDPAYQARAEQMIDDADVATLFVDTLFPPSWVDVVAEERGLDTAVLNPFEGQTLREAADEVTYRSVLLYDLRVLQDHLDCEAPT